MSNTNANTPVQPSEVAVIAVASKEYKATMHFKGYAADAEGFKRLDALLDSGKLTASDIEVIKEEGKPDKYKRNSVALVLSVPVITIEGMSKAMVEHIQCLVNKAVEQAQKPTVDAGLVADSDLISWQKVLEAPFAQRSAAIKVSAELIAAVLKVMKAGLAAMGTKEKAIELAALLGEKRYSLSACHQVPNEVLEKLQGLLAAWMETLEPSVLLECEPVLNLWAVNIEKVLKPAEEYSLDMF